MSGASVWKYRGMGTDQSRIMDQDPSLASTCSGTLIVSFEKDKNDGLFSKKKQHIYKQKASKAFLPHKRSLRNMFDKRKRIESKKGNKIGSGIVAKKEHIQPQIVAECKKN